MSVILQDYILTDIFMEMMLDHNDGGTKNLILRGSDLQKKIGRRIQNGDMGRIINFLRKHPEIVSLELPYNEIGNCGMFNLMKHIQDHPTIKYLNLIGNEIGAEGVKHIVALGNALPLYVLRLSGNKIGDEGARTLSSLLYLDIPLKVLDISDCHQTISGIAHILTGLMYNRGGSNKLEIIDIGRPLQQFYHQMCDAHAAEFFGQVLSFNTGLKEFHIQQYQLDFRDMEILLSGLQMNKHLQLLDLNNNNIGDDGVDYLCVYLRTNPPLSGLMIASNNIGDKGAVGLGLNLPYSNIKLLDISNNHINDKGILSILYSIKKLVPLKGLFLWGNKMSTVVLAVLNYYLKLEVLSQEHLDVKVYCSEEEFKAAWNTSANMYKHRFYSVSDYGHPPLRRITIHPKKPEKEPDITFRHHVDDIALGMPIYGP